MIVYSWILMATSIGITIFQIISGHPDDALSGVLNVLMWMPIVGRLSGWW